MKGFRAVFLLALLGFSILFLSPLSITVSATDDAYEDNDTGDNAKVIGEGIYTLIQEDDDWFSVDVPAYSTLRVIASPSSADDNIFLGLYEMDENMSYVEIDFSDSPAGQDEEVSVQTEAALATYWIKVGGDNVTDFEYKLSVGFIPIVYNDDAFEENDFPDNASLISEGKNTNLIQGDDDWYTFNANYTSEVQVYLDYFNYHDKLKMEIYHNITGQGMELIETLDSGSGHEAFNFKCFVDEIFFIYISGTNVNASYNLTIAIENRPRVDDPYEQNDNMAEAYFHELPFSDGITLWDDDWFGPYFLATDDVFSVMFEYDDMGGNDYLYAELVDENGYLVNSTDETHPNDIVWNNTGPGINIYLHLYGLFNGKRYNLTVDMIKSNHANPPPMDDDNFEENDRPEDASIINLNFSVNDLKLYDVDYYQMDLVEGDKVEIKLTGYSNADDLLRITLWDKDFNQIGLKQGPTRDSPFVMVIVANYTGSFYIEIDGDFNGQNYGLDVKILEKGEESPGGEDTEKPNMAIPGYPLEITMMISTMAIAAVLMGTRKRR